MGKPFIITRNFKAPRQLVWDMFTKAEHITNWSAPGAKTVLSKMDFRVGGSNHYGQQGDDGKVMYGMQHYKEIKAPEKLVYIQHFSDEAGGVTRHPLAPTWPERMLTTIQLKELGPKETELNLTWEAIDAKPEEQALFDGAHGGMTQGWGGSFQQIDEYLAKLQG